MTVRVIPFNREDRSQNNLTFKHVAIADGSKYPLLRLIHKDETISLDIIIPEGYCVVYDRTEEVLEEEL